MLSDSPTVELASDRTALAFDRTGLAADRTLMAIIRTSLSLISFGFTISEVFHQLRAAHVTGIGDAMPRTFGFALVLLGIVTLILGIFSHRTFFHNLTRRRSELVTLSLLRTGTQYRPTPTFATAIVLLLFGLAAAVVILLRNAFA
jgi:putative membrane protein